MLDKTAGARGEAWRRADDAPSPASQAVPNLRSLLDVLRRRKIPLLGCMVIVPLLAVSALKQVTPLYTATGTLIYEPGRYRTQELQSILQSDPITDAVMLSQVEVLHGLRTIEPMAQRLNLFSKPEFNPSLRPPSLFARYFGHDPPAADTTSGPPPRSIRNEVLLGVQRATVVRPITGSHVIEVSFTATDPVLAAAAVNGLMDIYIRAQLAAKFSAVDKARAWLERRASELRTELRSQEDRIATYRAQKGLVQGVHAELDVESVTQLTEALARARADLATAAGRLNATSTQAGEAPLADSVVRLREQEGTIAGELQSLQVRLGPKHPDVVALQRELAEVRAQEQAETSRVVSGTEAGLRAARDRVAGLERDLATAQTHVDQSAQAEIPLSLMQRDADASRALLTNVLQTLQETAQQAAVETPDAHEVSLALPPAQPAYPRTRAVLAAACVSGVLLGLFLVYLLEISDATLASGDDVRRQVRLPCLALVPNLSRRTLGRLRVQDYAALRPLGGFAEQMRALRTSLWIGQTKPRTIAITGARPAEGKTTLALSLARVAALSGERVILLDCDLRRPAMAGLLGLDGPGLAELLLDQAELTDVIRHDPLTPLKVVPAGAVGPGSAGLFMTGKMASLLQSLREDFTLVVMDAPPALAMADTRLIAQMADATLFCARWRRTTHDVARNAVALLEEAGANVAGVALTRVDAHVHFLSGYSDADACGPRLGGYFRG